MTDQQQPVDEPVDTGDFLHVDEAERLEHDDVLESEINADAGRVDFADVPDGDVVDLTADDEEDPR